MPKITCVIPARLQSSRFPRKVLANLGGRPLLQRVWEAATATECFHKIVVAVDSEELAEVVLGFGGCVEMTSFSCVNGTERMIELLESGRVEGDVFVNWQGDEPFIDRTMIQDLLQTCAMEDSDVWTLKKKIEEPSKVLSPQIAKVVTDAKGYALYFSRCPIPYYRDSRNEEDKNFYKHIGIYAYTREALLRLAKLELCGIEEAEQLEQLRFLYNGLRVRVHETQKEVIGIDLPEHLAAAELLMKEKFSLEPVVELG